MKAVIPLAAAVLLAIWGLPWAEWLGAFPAHMVRHMGLVAVAAPLLVLAAPALTAPLALSPLAGAILEFVVVWGFHLPAVHQASAQGIAPFVVEQGVFLLVGVIVWAGCLRAEPLSGAGGLLLTSMHMTLLGALLTLAPRVLYTPDCVGSLPEQQLGGMLMLAIGTPIYLAAGLWRVNAALLTPKDDPT